MRYFVYWLSFSIICITAWIYANFGSPLIEQIIMQIGFADLSQKSFPTKLIRTFIRDCIIYPMFFTVVISCFEFFIKVLLSDLIQNIKITSKIVNLCAKFFMKVFIHNTHICLLIISLTYLETTLSVHHYIKSQLYRNIAYLDYVDPKRAIITSNKDTKNLILIYAESIESSFKDEKLFKKNLLKNLDSLQGLNFKEFNQLPGTGWTIAGIFASQCGDYINLKFLEKEYFCLSDILNQQGYHNVYMQGASLNFTYTGIFLKKHQYHELYGREEWQEQGYYNLNDWGLYDDDLFEQAKLKLRELQNNKKLFNLTMLTVDTHAPGGFVSKTCQKRGASSYNDIVECSTSQIADFIKFVKDNGYLENTNVIVIGDHLYPIDHKLPEAISNYKRTIFNLFIAKEYPNKKRENITHFDLLPSILKFIGFDIKGNNLFLGKSAF